MSDYKNFDENRIKHLEFIQEIIKRMASNSFLIKGWCAALYSALFVFFLKDFRDADFISLFLIVPGLCFAILDAYYLSIERSYRAKYRSVQRSCGGCSPFDLGLPQLSLCESAINILDALKSPSIWAYYFPFMLFSIISIIYIFNN